MGGVVTVTNDNILFKLMYNLEFTSDIEAVCQESISHKMCLNITTEKPNSVMRFETFRIHTLR